MAQIRHATREDMLDLSGRLGYGDLIEVHALGLKPLPALLNALNTAQEAWVAVVDGRVEVTWGVSKPIALARVPSPFLLASDRVPKFEFVRVAQYTAAHWRDKYPILKGYVDARNLRAQRWLGWLGFETGKVVPAGPYGRPFLEIWLSNAVREAHSS